MVLRFCFVFAALLTASANLAVAQPVFTLDGVPSGGLGVGFLSGKTVEGVGVSLRFPFSHRFGMLLGYTRSSLPEVEGDGDVSSRSFGAGAVAYPIVQGEAAPFTAQVGVTLNRISVSVPNASDDLTAPTLILGLSLSRTFGEGTSILVAPSLSSSYALARFEGLTQSSATFAVGGGLGVRISETALVFAEPSISFGSGSDNEGAVLSVMVGVGYAL